MICYKFRVQYILPYVPQVVFGFHVNSNVFYVDMLLF